MSAIAGPACERLGDRAVLLRWGTSADVAINAGVHVFAGRVRALAPAWLVDLVPAYASLAVFFDPVRVVGEEPAAVVADWLRDLAGAPAALAPATPARLVEIPVHYGGADGPDLDAVAASCGMSPAQVIARHSAVEYPVAMLGFSPGFPYLLGLDPALATPRLATPRVRVPAGSVGIGGSQTGVYPDAGPGGWRLIGRTPLALFDPARERPVLLAPGDRVRFVASGPKALPQASGPTVRPPDGQAGGVEVIAGGLATTVQDLGRPGHRHLGVGVGGVLDRFSARVGNLLVGNPEGAALLEITLAGPRLRFRTAVRIAITGADIDATADGLALPGWRPVVLPAGSELVLGACRRGARAYLAIAGGLQLPDLLGSRSTDLRAGFGGLGGRCLGPGDRLAPGAPAQRAGTITVAAPSIAAWWVDPQPDLDFGRTVVVRVLAGRDALTPADALAAAEWRVSAQSNRQGLRLQGPPLALATPADTLSEPVAPGTVQLPPDGQPIVLLAEAQTIGGYPRIGHVIAADLPRLAQLRPGDTLRFEPIDAAAAHALACAQRHRLNRMALAIESRLRADRSAAPP